MFIFIVSKKAFQKFSYENMSKFYFKLAAREKNEPGQSEDSFLPGDIYRKTRVVR